VLESRDVAVGFYEKLGYITDWGAGRIWGKNVYLRSYGESNLSGKRNYLAEVIKLGSYKQALSYCHLPPRIV